MEVKGGDSNKIAVCISEMIGTALLLMALNLSGPDGSTDAQAVSGSIFISIITFGQISGGHFNPAITIAVWFKMMMFDRHQIISNISNLLFALLIIISQILGAMFGVLIS